MTDRAEIERLLNQTGRTLEGLPEKHNTADVIDCITCINAGQGAYRRANVFAERILHQSDVIELLVGALRDALDERNYAVLRLCEQDGCEGCKHEECPHEDEPCVSCCRMWQYEEDDNWEFGILGKKVEVEW